jgi:hypothetical protein
MTRLRTTLLLATMSIVPAMAARAQAWPAGSVGFDKTIYAKIYIGVGDAVAPPLPIAGVRMLLVSAGNDTVRLATDGAGAVAAYVPRGEYHLLSLDEVIAGGQSYKWSIPLTIAPGMRDIELTAQNATSPPQLIVSASPAEIGPPISQPAVTEIPSIHAPKDLSGRRRMVDNSGFVWEVFEQTFGKGVVRGTWLPLPTVQVTLVFDRDAETRQLDQFPANWRSLSNTELSGWLVKARRVRP